MRFWFRAAFPRYDGPALGQVMRAIHLMPSTTILTTSNREYLDKSLKYMVSRAGFEPATY